MAILSCVSSENLALDPFITGEEKAVCPMCSKTFSKQSQLLLHQKVHFFEGQHQCKCCGLSFGSRLHLRKHSRSSCNVSSNNNTVQGSNPRPFRCTDCEVSFRSLGHLARHLRSKLHVMKLEHSGKLPYGMYSQMQRNGSLGLHSIDTVNSQKAFESLRKLAYQLYSSVPEDPKVSESNNVTPENSQCERETSSFNSVPISMLNSSTCKICSKIFKSNKFLQVHIYSEHPEQTQ